MKTISFLIRSHVTAVALVMAFATTVASFGQDRSEAAHARGADLKGTTPGGTTTSGSTTVGTTAAGSVTPGTVTASANGRQIQVSAVEPASVNVSGANAEVKVAGQTLLVEKSKLILDGKTLGDMPPETKKVEVTVKEGMLSVIGDGKELARAKLTPPMPQ